MITFRNDFLKWHLAFVIPYGLTYILGFLREHNTLAYKLHPFAGMATVVIPLIVYLLLPNKRVIHQMFKSNFSMRCSPLMKVARISTLFILFYFGISVLTGMLLNLGLYTVTIYKIISPIHNIAKLLVPIAVIAHVYARLQFKKQRSRRD